jgi:hypothetical protein
MTDPTSEQWLKDIQAYFREVQSYNTTVITVGYATFFGLLAFLEDKIDSWLLFVAGLLIAISAVIFAGYELVRNIHRAWEAHKIAADDKSFSRFWFICFTSSVMSAAVGVGLLLWLFLGKLLA